MKRTLLCLYEYKDGQICLIYFKTGRFAPYFAKINKKNGFSPLTHPSA